ncbi:MAG: class III extradiol ring-cleavage dioxygenase [Pseudomonadota bacterium]
MTKTPSLFISHGAPLLAIEDGPAHRFLRSLGDRLKKPKAIIMVSAHHIARPISVTLDEKPETIHDFGGFPKALFDITYGAPGDPMLAERIVGTLNAAGFSAAGHVQRGFDHGAWVPMFLMYPNADVPMVQVSIDLQKSPLWHYHFGQALSVFGEDGMLVIGSGSITHNLHEWMTGHYGHDAASPAWVTRFTEWLAKHLEACELSAVLDAVSQAPDGHRNHPTMDHILPLFVALGAGTGQHSTAKRLHKSTTYGVLGMDVYRFGDQS